MSADPIHFAVRLSDGAWLHETDAVAAALEAEGCAWAHLQADHHRAEDWIEARLGYLPEPVREALTAGETRPRAMHVGGGLLLNLRGVNLNPGAEPEDMISLRVWVDEHRIVTLSRRPLRTIERMADLYRAGHGPTRAGAFVALLVEWLTDRIEQSVEALDDRTDALEERLIQGDSEGLRAEITEIRSALVDYRRFLVPQRDVVGRLTLPRERGLLSHEDLLELTESEDEMRRLVETLESVRDRLLVIRDELQGLSDARLNRNLYILSVVSAVFLPLSFLTGLMGINVAGMPGEGWEPAFWVFTAGCGALLLVLLVAMWRLRVLRVRR